MSRAARPREHAPRTADVDRVRTVIRARHNGYMLVGTPRRERPQPARSTPAGLRDQAERRRPAAA